MEVDQEIYFGPLQNDLPHEEGECVNMFAAVFKGTWLDVKKEELHVGKDEDGRIYE